MGKPFRLFIRSPSHFQRIGSWGRETVCRFVFGTERDSNWWSAFWGRFKTTVSDLAVCDNPWCFRRACWVVSDFELSMVWFKEEIKSTWFGLAVYVYHISNRTLLSVSRQMNVRSVNAWAVDGVDLSVRLSFQHVQQIRTWCISWWTRRGVWCICEVERWSVDVQTGWYGVELTHRCRGDAKLR